jgi:hypothetical protein
VAVVLEDNVVVHLLELLELLTLVVEVVEELHLALEVKES